MPEAKGAAARQRNPVLGAGGGKGRWWLSLVVGAAYCATLSQQKSGTSLSSGQVLRGYGGGSGAAPSGGARLGAEAGGVEAELTARKRRLNAEAFLNDALDAELKDAKPGLEGVGGNVKGIFASPKKAGAAERGDPRSPRCSVQNETGQTYFGASSSGAGTHDVRLDFESEACEVGAVGEDWDLKTLRERGHEGGDRGMVLEKASPGAALHDTSPTLVGDGVHRGRDMTRSPASARSEAPKGFSGQGPGLSPRSSLPPSWVAAEIESEMENFVLDESEPDSGSEEPPPK